MINPKRGRVIRWSRSTNSPSRQEESVKTINLFILIERKKNILIPMNNWVNWVIGICLIIGLVIELFFN
ncbi:MAG: hypothetical protein CMP93_00590 [Gammaproteobacteria bacterium]|nr:hypothetical protein [Gammaproteobacteria bacterium]